MGTRGLTSLPGMVAGGRSGDAALASELAGYLRRVLDDQSKQVKRERSATEEGAYARVHHLLAVLTDEVFLVELERPPRWGEQELRDFRREWLSHLLEGQLYGTSHGGKAVVEDMRHVLASGSQLPFAEQLAGTYLLALQLGFRGALRSPHGQDETPELRRRLLRLVSTEGGIEPRPQLTEQAYRHVENPPEGKRLRRWFRWRWVMVMMVVGYLVVSSALWVIMTWGLDQG